MRIQIPAKRTLAKDALIALAAVASLFLPAIVRTPITMSTHAQSRPARVGATINVKPSGAKFEVASIKPSPQPAQHIGITSNGSRVDIGNWSILQLIVKAYRIQTYQLIGPEWMWSARFDVQASLPRGSSKKSIPEMLQALLAERFGLVAHTETRDLQGFALVVGKGGPKIKVAASDPASNAKDEEIDALDQLWGSGEAFGATARLLPNRDVRTEFQKIPMDALAQFLCSNLKAPVTDMTGLRGNFHVVLDYDPATVGNATVANPASAGDLFAAVTRLGLKLERRSVHCSVLVVDHVQPVPTAN